MLPRELQTFGINTPSPHHTNSSVAAGDTKLQRIPNLPNRLCFNKKDWGVIVEGLDSLAVASSTCVPTPGWFRECALPVVEKSI